MSVDAFILNTSLKTYMAGTSPAMTWINQE